MTWRVKLVYILSMQLTIRGSELTSNLQPIKFGQTRQDYNTTLLKNKTDTGQFLLNDEHFESEFYRNDDKSTAENIKAKVKFNDYSAIENLDYIDYDNPSEINNKQIVFDDVPLLPEPRDTVKSAIKFETDTTRNSGANGHITFVDDGVDQKLIHTKKKKRRRRPKNQTFTNPPNPDLNHQGTAQTDPGFETRFPGQINSPNYGYQDSFYQRYQGPLYPGQNPGLVQANPITGLQIPGSVQPGYLVDPAYQYYGIGPPGLEPGLNGHYRPTRRPKSLATKAISALSEALSSIATNDDYQCVPRLLCEAAGGRASGSTLLQSVTGLEPLLSVISTYNAISTSPLFVFGRAVFLGMTSKGNTASCRYAYPQCPTDPEKLIHYLNNHNGGFFRFFNSPLPHQNQNVEQFYNQLAGQYGLYEPNGQHSNLGQGQYGLVHNNNFGTNQNLYESNKNYGVNYNKYGFYKQGQENIEDRIQNKPAYGGSDEGVIDDTIDSNSKWLFPNDINNNDINYEIKPSRISKTIRFPNENKPNVVEHKDYFRKGKIVLFPESNTRFVKNYQSTTPPVSVDDYVFDHKHNFYVKRPKPEAQKVEDDGLKTVYIVRGNGDPNHPEVVKYRPGYT